MRYTDYAAEKVRTLCPTAPTLRARWADPAKRAEIIERLDERGIDFDELAEAAGQPDADPFDLLCHLAFNAPLRTRRERAQRLRSERKDFFDRYGPEARQILDELLEKYAEHGDCPVRAARRPEGSAASPATATSPRSSSSSVAPDKLRARRDRAAEPALRRVRDSMARTNEDRPPPRPPPSRSAASSSPRATSCARTRASTATSTACRCSPGSCSSSSSTTWSCSARRRPTLAGKKFRPAIEPPYRWRDWAANPDGITGDELLAFINQDEAVRPDGKRGPGLFAYLRALTSANGDDRRDVIATVFRASTTAWRAATCCATSSTRSPASTSRRATSCTRSARSTSRCCARCATRRATPASSTRRAPSCASWSR